MSDKEYTVIEIVDVLRRQAAGDNISSIARSTGMDRKTVRKYIRSAEEKGFTKDADVDIEGIAYLDSMPQRHSLLHRLSASSRPGFVSGECWGH